MCLYVGLLFFMFFNILSLSSFVENSSYLIIFPKILSHCTPSVPGLWNFDFKDVEIYIFILYFP